MTNCALIAFLQSVPARVRVWWGRWGGQGDSGWRVHWVIHGQDQAGAADCHFIFCQGKLVIQAFISWTPGSAGGGGAFAVDGAGPRRICADGDIGIHGAHTGIVQDEVRLIIMELTFILVYREGSYHHHSCHLSWI